MGMLPRQQWHTHRSDLALPYRAIIPAVKTIPDAIGIDKIFMRAKHAIRTPVWEPPVFFIMGIDSRYFPAIDIEPTAQRINSVAGAGGNRLEDVPVSPEVPGPLMDIRSGQGRYPKINDCSHTRFFIHTSIQARLHAGRGIDNNLPIRQHQRECHP